MFREKEKKTLTIWRNVPGSIRGSLEADLGDNS